MLSVAPGSFRPCAPASVAREVRPKQGIRLSRRTLLAASAALAFSAGNARANQPLRLVALGDSLTAGFGLPAGDSFPQVLQRKLADKGQQVRIANAGVSGDTAEGGLARLDWSVPKDTQGVILELGANDALRGLDTNGCEQALDQIIARLKARGTGVLLAGMYAPRNLGKDYIKAFDSIYPRLARKYGIALYPFFLDGVAGDPQLTQPDGLHPTAAGVETIVDKMLPSVETFVASLTPK